MTKARSATLFMLIIFLTCTAQLRQSSYLPYFCYSHCLWHCLTSSSHILHLESLVQPRTCPEPEEQPKPARKCYNYCYGIAQELCSIERMSVTCKLSSRICHVFLLLLTILSQGFNQILLLEFVRSTSNVSKNMNNGEIRSTTLFMLIISLTYTAQLRHSSYLP